MWIAARVGFLSALSVAGEPSRTLTRHLGEPGNSLNTRPFAAASAADAAATEGNLKPVASVLPPIDAIIKRRPKKATGGAILLPSFLQPDRVSPRTLVAEPSQIIWLPASPVRQPKSGLNVYAYSFFRQGAKANSLAGGGQYGGGQSGFVATYTLARFGEGGTDRLSIQARGAAAHGDPSERELAAGLRWQPLRKVPVTLTAERRFRGARPDAFAVFMAGGKSQVSLPVKFKLDAFAQGGLVSGRDGGPFFDAAARAERKLTTIGKTPVTFGAGIWGGGQKDIFRVDAGPTIGIEVPLGNTRLRINADWRFRIAGDAQPASGPALTLSTSF